MAAGCNGEIEKHVSLPLDTAGARMHTAVGRPSISSGGRLGRSSKTHVRKRTTRGAGDDDARRGGSAERAGRRERLGVYGSKGEVGKVLIFPLRPVAFEVFFFFPRSDVTILDDDICRSRIFHQ